MAPIVIVTGSPGAGKTTRSARLAKASRRGVHIEGDRFYEFGAHPVTPTLPESHHQLTAVIRATVRAAADFASGGYEVFLDGIFGLWFLPVIASELEPGGAATVRHIHAAFAKVGDYTDHALEVGERTPEEVVSEFLHRRESGDFHLDLSQVRRAAAYPSHARPTQRLG